MALDQKWIDRWVAGINNDESCQNSGRQFNDSVTFSIGDSRYTFKVVHGKVDKIVLTPVLLLLMAFRNL